MDTHLSPLQGFALVSHPKTLRRLRERGYQYLTLGDIHLKDVDNVEDAIQKDGPLYWELIPSRSKPVTTAGGKMSFGIDDRLINTVPDPDYVFVVAVGYLTAAPARINRRLLKYRRKRSA